MVLIGTFLLFLIHFLVLTLIMAAQCALCKVWQWSRMDILWSDQTTSESQSKMFTNLLDPDFEMGNRDGFPFSNQFIRVNIGTWHSSLKCEIAWESILMRQNCMRNSRWSCGVSKFMRWKHLYNGTFLIPLCTFPWEKNSNFLFHTSLACMQPWIRVCIHPCFACSPGLHTLCNDASPASCYAGTLHSFACTV